MPHAGAGICKNFVISNEFGTKRSWPVLLYNLGTRLEGLNNGTQTVSQDGPRFQPNTSRTQVRGFTAVAVYSVRIGSAAPAVDGGGHCK